jgi:endogenous inhibitor of DNA gyrase (YacG/DUF329 family)
VPSDSVPCALCRQKLADPAFKPFCSERCRLLDLARWIDGDYRIPAEPVSPDVPESDDAPQS